MRILLVGEYSRLHNSLKEGLIKNGHEVTLIGSGDLFKNYPVDINIDAHKVKNNFLINKIRHFIYFTTSIDIASIEIISNVKKHKKQLIDYDVVQLINETPFNIGPYFEKRLLNFIFRNNSNVFLSACGDDHVFISYLLSNQLPYSTFTPFLKNKKLKKHYKFPLRYITKKHRKLHDFVFKNIKAVIPASVEYSIAYSHIRKTVPLIPNAVNVDIIQKTPLSTEGKIKIFHGINSSNTIKKGHQYFKEALDYIIQNYNDKIEITTTKDLPYADYIKKYKEAHIVLDQAQAHDQGYNALEAMAMGKVVFTGAGSAFRNYYNLDKTVAIDATPDSKKIAQSLEKLILNPKEIIQIGNNAREFIEKEHHYMQIAKKYVETWKINS
ncbi:glycosyltransferase [Aquimarina sp. 2201CG5-10]|uniref:glycosyltransferase n=1 Tax=Aquimarina callyspongiae TaxID=3098150 RepID=UPI002AB55D6C|nr:glycosyltransferase [Aquimarina sp. 2201CG5-10]MDY8138559.1 glycosyltransferase [Aquimarina sp. 2201CG5-10]